MTFTYRYRKQIIVGILLTIFLTGGIGGVIFFNRNVKKSKTTEVFKVTKKKTKQEQKKEVEVYKVDIKGEVINPGIYTVEKNSRVMDAIIKAGGLTDNADTSVINLSKKLSDEIVIIVYSYEEVNDFKKTKELEETVQGKCIEGGNYDLKNNACIENEQDEKTTLSGKISINTATKEELQNLPGIGESKAKAIIEYREKNGAFLTIEDIQKVSGIGDNIFAQIKENITT